mmetsp:Transcript_14820/g.44770  ORF Transcript_14820/g.44770 Transcript_14820/m.44770 type:complete len:204 (+) Transcript_14820:404-1015(+)
MPGRRPRSCTMRSQTWTQPSCPGRPQTPRASRQAHRQTRHTANTRYPSLKISLGLPQTQLKCETPSTTLQLIGTATRVRPCCPPVCTLQSASEVLSQRACVHSQPSTLLTTPAAELVLTHRVTVATCDKALVHQSLCCGEGLSCLRKKTTRHFFGESLFPGGTPAGSISLPQGCIDRPRDPQAHLRSPHHSFFPYHQSSSHSA